MHFDKESNDAATLASRKERFSNDQTSLPGNKFKILEAQRPALTQQYIRDLKMSDPERTYTLLNQIKFQAECTTMCPEFEIEEREFKEGLDYWEKLPNGRVDHSKTVKRFKRSDAGAPPPLPCDVRTPDTLKVLKTNQKTLNYLFTLALTKGIIETHSFVRDRARSIRNDLVLQNCRSKAAIELHEQIARYHILCTNVVLSKENFVLQQELEQLQKTMISLVEYYSDMNKNGIKNENEAEFQAYYMLIMGADVITRAEVKLSDEVFFSTQVQLAIRIRGLYDLNHYSKIFDILRQPSTSYLFVCCVQTLFVDIQLHAITVIFLNIDDATTILYN
jgi:hypothetical protein